MSTYCRACGQYFKLSVQTPATKTSSIGAMLGRMMKGGTQPVPAPPAASHSPILPRTSRQPALPLQLTGTDEKQASLVATTSSLRPTAQDQNGGSREAPRQVECFDCHAVHRASRTASSTQCPQCSAYIDLRDVEIKERTTQRIRTRGDVEIGKKGAFLGTSIHCGNLTIYGSVTGSIYASGTVQLHSDTKIIGEIRCRRLVMDRKFEVHCLQPVHAGEIEISGHLHAHCHATRSITLTRTGVMEGNVHAPAIIMEPGAVLNGQVKVQNPEARLHGRTPAPISETIAPLLEGMPVPA